MAAKTMDQRGAGTRMKLARMTLQRILQACMDERVTATRQMEKVAKLGRWMFNVLPKSGFGRRK